MSWRDSVTKNGSEQKCRKMAKFVVKMTVKFYSRDEWKFRVEATVKFQVESTEQKF